MKSELCSPKKQLGNCLKKIIPILFLFFIIYGVTHKEEIIIPDYAIRFRVIANSDSFLDQSTKIKVKDEVENKLDSLMQEAKNSTEAKELINANLKTNSKYKINDKLIFGVLTNYSVDGGKLSLEITGKEKIVGTYYFETKSEKKNFIGNVEIGDKLKIIGNLKLPSQK